MATYLKGKKNKNEFEMLMRRSLMTFHEEALIAAQELEEMDYGSRIEKARTSYEMCHGSYNYHNVLFTDRGCAVTGFEHCCVDCQINDLYQFMRKLLEKNGWDARAGHSVIEAYSEVRPVSDDDMKLLRINFLYPEKFWKVINFYNNSNKSWIPRKSIEKLEGVLAQNDARKAFIETLH